MRQRPIGRKAAFDCFVAQAEYPAYRHRADGVLGIVRSLQRGPARLIDGVDILRRDAEQTMVDASGDRLRRIVVGRDDRDLIAVLEREEPCLGGGIARKAVDRTTVVSGNRGSVRVALGGSRLIKKK